MASFRLLPEAEKDLESIWQYSAEIWGVNQTHAHHVIVFIQSEVGIDVVRVLYESMDVDSQLEE